MTPFVRPSYVNLHHLQGRKKGSFVFQTVPGYTLFAEGGSPARGCITTNDRTFFVLGSGLYELFALGGLVLRGTLGSDAGPVSMAYGITQLVVVDGSRGYVLTLADNDFEQIAADGFYGSHTVTFIDNYFLFVRPDTGQFYLSAINDATTFDSLDFATAEAQPDNLIAIASCQRRGLLMGSKTTEIWSNSGGADFPFEREGTTIEVGCMAPHSVQSLDNTAFWVGADENGGGIVYRLNGYQAQRVSDDDVDESLQTSTDLTRAVAYSYQENGLTFYALNAPGLTSTWVYEVSSGEWHKRCDLDAIGQFKADRGVCHAFAFGYHLIGASDGNIYRLDRSVHTKAGDPLVREYVFPQVSERLGHVFFDALHLDCTTGDAPQGVDPRVELSWSDDQGAMWSNPVANSSGKVGERFQRLTWRRLGRSMDRLWKLRTSDNARFDIVNVQVDTHAGNS
jgi:hypothetical protein